VQRLARVHSAVKRNIICFLVACRCRRDGANRIFHFLFVIGGETMDLSILYSLQRQLDERIEKQHGLQGEDLFDKKVLALLVEIGELANETRCFKFWSVKPSSPQEKVLEEYVDGLHFILSLGLECGFMRSSSPQQTNGNGAQLVERFLRVFWAVDEFRKTKSQQSYDHLLTEYLQLGEQLGFSFTQIEQAYIRKNKVNHERQNQNY
jgi:dimeric dUTPase (all-alpha-NTP-PPase superfamily)